MQSGPSTKPAGAASILVYTKDGKVLAGERRSDLAFLGGFTVFPGGRIDPRDEEAADRWFGATDPVSIGKAAALRELHEETGLHLEGDRLVRAASIGFTPIEPSRLAAAPRWITPENVPIRFDTQFFCLEVASAEDPVPADDELTWAAWLTPQVILQRWAALELLLATPTLAVLRAIAEGLDDPAGRIARLLDRAQPMAMEGIAGIRQLALRTPTLPPATHTNAYLIGVERFVVVDPATYEDGERAKLLREIADLEARGGVLDSVVLTHHHPDHVGAAAWLSAQRGVPIAAHPITRDLLQGRLVIERLLGEGDRLDLGRDAAGQRFELEVLFTPGHAPGHVVLRDLRPGSGALIAGDMIAAVGTIIIDPPEGDMSEYLRQLARLRDLEARMVFPAHGPGVLGGRKKLQQYIDHRLMREAKVERALSKQIEATPEQLLPDAYDDTPPFLYPLAARSCLAHLLKLVEDGKASQHGAAFRPSA